MKNTFILILLLLTFNSCRKDDKNFITEGYYPVYIDKQEAFNISFSAANQLTDVGKFYIKDTLVYIMEPGVGIHIIDNSSAFTPQNIGFINLYGVNDIAIKGNILFADNFTDLVAIDISKIDAPKLVKRIKNVYPLGNQMAPPFDCWFECVDTTKGYVIKWVKSKLTNPRCYKGIVVDENDY